MVITSPHKIIFNSSSMVWIMHPLVVCPSLLPPPPHLHFVMTVVVGSTDAEASVTVAFIVDATSENFPRALRGCLHHWCHTPAGDAS